MDWTGRARSFSRDHIFDPVQLAVVTAAGAVLLLCLLLRVRTVRRGSPSSRGGALAGLLASRSQPAENTAESGAENCDQEYRYDARVAWIEAGIFIAVCFISSWAAGVLDATFFSPTWPTADAAFLAFTSASFAVVVVGYWLIWPVGTVAYGRCWSWYCLFFGVLDGLAESQLFLCIWSAVELFGLPRYGTGVITFFLQGGFKANWDQKYWNVRVAPAHNIETWNKWKVLLVHVPNVLVTFSYFITYGNATLYCATQTLALIGSTSFMRFPSPFSKYTNPPLRSQVKNYADRARADLWRTDHWEDTGV